MPSYEAITSHPNIQLPSRTLEGRCPGIDCKYTITWTSPKDLYLGSHSKSPPPAPPLNLQLIIACVFLAVISLLAAMKVGSLRANRRHKRETERIAAQRASRRREREAERIAAQRVSRQQARLAARQSVERGGSPNEVDDSPIPFHYDYPVHSIRGRTRAW